MEVIDQVLEEIRFDVVGETFIGNTSPWINYIPGFNRFSKPNHLFYFMIDIDIEFQFESSLSFRGSVATMFYNGWKRPTMEDLALFGGQSIKKINELFNERLIEKELPLPKDIIIKHLQNDQVNKEILDRIQLVLDQDFPSDKWS
jgi:hypothetical protein